MAVTAGPSTVGTRRFRVNDPLGIVLPVVVSTAAVVIRSWRVGRPGAYVFDEVYYVPDAVSFLHGGAEGAWVHPPLGKWLIAGGIKALGDRPVGWRIASVVFGTLVVLLTYVLARRLLGSKWWATLASALVATDGLQVVQSRIATLEIFLTGFVLCGALLAHQYVTRPPPEDSRMAGIGWLAGAGVMFGAALAVKWSALPVIAFAAVGIVARSENRRRAARVVTGLLGLVPLLVYVLSYATFWRRHGPDVGNWIELQRAMLAFHGGDIAGHRYASSSLGWLTLRRPVAYFYEVRGDDVRHIVALGNPLLWWAFLATVPALLRAWVRRGDHRADVVVLALAALYFPWLLVRRTSFLYYLAPLVPFMAIGVAWALQRLWVSSLPRPVRFGVVIYIVGAFAAAALLMPVWLGLPIDFRYWRRLMVFDSWI